MPIPTEFIFAVKKKKYSGIEFYNVYIYILFIILIIWYIIILYADKGYKDKR